MPISNKMRKKKNSRTKNIFCYKLLEIVNTTEKYQGSSMSRILPSKLDTQRCDNYGTNV